MLHTESLPHQGIYTPLSQAMTDSESDEEIEIHNSKKHRQQRHHQQHQQQQHTQPLTQLQSGGAPKRNRRKAPPNTLALNQTYQTKLNHNHNRFQCPQKFQLDTQTVSKPNINAVPSSYTTNMQHTFRSVMLSDMGGSTGGAEFSNFNSDYDNTADNVAILGNGHHANDTNGKDDTQMSPVRRCCFIASIMLCLFAVFGFVWLVPCGEGSACPAPGDRIKTHNWLNNYTKIELKGGINIVNGLRSWENNLIFLYRGDAFFPEFRPGNYKRNGIISLIGSSGAVAWYDEMVDEPVAIDCTLIDVDHNGRPDCLCLDEYGELGAINPVSGQWHWRYKERSAHKVDAFDFPVILPDLDGDGVLEILLVSSILLEQRTKAYVQQKESPNSKKFETRNILRILSGRHGNPIGDAFQIHDCDIVRKLQLEKGQSVTFTCVRNSTEAQQSKSLAELYALITNKSIVGQKLQPPATKISQHRFYGQRKEIDSQRNIYSLSGRELVVENRGKCPEDCNVTLLLSETRNGKTKVLRNFTNSAMYGMVPAQWHFKNSKSKMSGFVMKFWKWHHVESEIADAQTKQDALRNYTNHTIKNQSQNTIKDATKAKNKSNIGSKQQYQNQSKKNRQKSNSNLDIDSEPLDHAFPASEFDHFEHVIQKRDTFNVPTKNQSNIQKTSSSLMLDNYKMQMITETVILVLFIGADTRIENTSQSNIVQFCRKENKNSDEMLCQPDLNNQENSMLIADLDQDGSQELVSYMTTFVPGNDDDSDTWKLVTYVRLLRLQSELPAFYDEEKRNY